MKKIIEIFFSLCFLAFVIMISCNNKTKPDTPKTGTEKIIAILTRTDSTRTAEVLFRRIDKTIKFDSADKKDVIVIDTFWYYEFVERVQKDGKDVLDSLGKQVFQTKYLQLNKDSVNWHVENKNVDSLLKKR